MKDELTHAQAMILFEQAYRHQVRGEISDAIELYRRSIAIHPTAEAYTFLGWSYSMVNRLDEAIDMCEKAIAVDPSFGNPYNDIGAYLIEKGNYREAIPWLEEATAAVRYNSPQMPYMNLGRAYEKLRRFQTALDYYNQSLEIDPLFMPAYWAKTALLGRMN